MDQANEKLPKSEAVVLLYFIQPFQNIVSCDLSGVSWKIIIVIRSLMVLGPTWAWGVTLIAAKAIEIRH